MLKNTSVIEEYGQFLIPNTNVAPLIVKGQGAELEDDQGNKFIDLEGGPGVVSTGHCHPKVVAAVREQAGKLMQGPGRNHTPLSMTLAKRIVEAVGGGIKRVFFANSGAESNDGAIKISLKHALATGKQGLGIFALEHGFHGRLSLPLSLTGMASRKKGFGPYAQFPGVMHVPAPYCYRCPFDLKPNSCGLKCADAVERMLKTHVPGEAAIMIAEPILGVGGVIPPPDGYWKKIEEICHQNKITLIYDEVFTGFGRTGKMFAHQHWNLKPDVITFAKAIGGGMPLAGFASTDEIASTFDPGDHFTTFGSNNQVGLAAAHAVLDVLKEESLVEKAATSGATFMKGLEALKARFPVMGDIRGKGLMIGVELVKDPKSKAPAAEETKKVQQEMRQSGILVSITGNFGCVLRITPPLLIDAGQIEQSLNAMEKALGTVQKSLP